MCWQGLFCVTDGYHLAITMPIVIKLITIDATESHEYFAKNMLGKELEKKLSELIADARQKAENTVLSTLEKNLREQLSADIINRLNIPSMLKSLQEKAAEIELDGN